MYTPERLARWTRPDDYAGATWEGYYGAGFGRSRDSDALERANFDAAWAVLEPLGAEVVREGHWAVGWVEWIAIHESNEPALRAAEGLRERYENYPVLDESRYSDYEWEECVETWKGCFDAADRVRYFRNHSYNAGSLADILRAVRGDWSAAAEVLHCPSDLLS